MRVLVTGGVRSGKSAHAEHLLADRDAVTYVATGPEPSADDPAWAARVQAHQDRRPEHWITVSEVPATGTVLLDSLSTWVTAQLDDLNAWPDDPRTSSLSRRPDEPAEATTRTSQPRTSSLSRRGDKPTHWHPAYAARVDTLLAAVTTLDDLVVVTDEVGLGGIGADPSTRLFADLLGDLNQQIGALCDQVHLVVAGRVVRL